MQAGLASPWLERGRYSPSHERLVAVPSIGTTSLPTLGNAMFGFVLADARPTVPAALHLSAVAGLISLPPCSGYLLAPTKQ